jgi:hypothetical protein
MLTRAPAGREYEKSGATLDLRYVPPGTEFTNPVRESATEVPAKYTPPVFDVKSSTSTKVELTWDQVRPHAAAAGGEESACDEETKWRKFEGGGGTALAPPAPPLACDHNRTAFRADQAAHLCPSVCRMEAPGACGLQNSQPIGI